MELQCQEALPLVDAYLDGELGEARAGPLRRHLLSCRECRGSAQEGRARARWFSAARESSRALAVPPPGFAARVARRAFAGDTGDRGLALASAREQEADSTLQFVLRLTALAAAIVIALSLWMRVQRLPSGSSLHADDRALVPVKELQERLDRLNRGEALVPRRSERRGEEPVLHLSPVPPDVPPEVPPEVHR